MKSRNNEIGLAYHELSKHLNGSDNFVNLPKTSLPLRMSAAREMDIQEGFGFAGLYQWQKNRSSTIGRFCVHDGPPYANGEPHMGHFLNKTLKDVICRYKMMTGHRVHFVPGWDCHGLPVELKALTGVQNFRKLTPLNIREKARSIAEQQITRQKGAFKRWGVMADFENEFYCTFNHDYEANQISVFHQMYEKGCIYRGFKPIYWSPSSKTALAEAELEYKDLVSLALYFNLPLHHPNFSNSDKPPNLLVWTTTPWTLPANEAICYNPELNYCLAKANGQAYIFALDRKIELEKEVFLTELEVLNVFEGSFLRGSRYTHPIFPEKSCPLLPGSHVTETSGTGLVHTAPAHGPDDYVICKENDIKIECGVDEDGKYTDIFGTELQGKEIFSEGNSKVLSMMDKRGLIVNTSQYSHRYPHDWRTRGPVFLRATPQWFANVSNLMNIAEEALKEVKMLPPHSRSILLTHLAGRKDWCISRQRCWGVPIPVFYSQDHTPLITSESVEQIKTIFRRDGTDAWWKLPVDCFLTPKVLKSFGKTSPDECVKQEDTLDVWFDSGTSWATVLKDVDGVADLYIEGSDQHRGWFQSSLLTSVASQGRAPFKTVITHGFVLDETNHKMSKSLGNVTDPDDLINGNKKKKIPPYGADVVRLWAASSDYTKDISVGSNILDQFGEKYRKIRNTFRFMSGNLDEFTIQEDGVAYEELYDIDKYMLHLLRLFLIKVDAAYESYSIPTVTKQVIELCTSDLSAFYFIINKDRLYLHEQFGTSRKGCQTTLYTCMYQILKSIAPILPHLAEEVIKYHNVREMESIFCSKEWLRPQQIWENYEVADRWELLRNMRHSINQWFSTEDIKKPLDYYITIALPDGKVLQELKYLQEEMVSKFSPLNDAMGTSVTTLKRYDADKVHTDEARVEDSIKHHQFFLKHPRSSEEVPIRIDLSKPTASKCTRCWKLVAVDSVNKYCESCLVLMMQCVKRKTEAIKEISEPTSERRI